MTAPFSVDTFSEIEVIQATEHADTVDATLDSSGLRIEGLGGDDWLTGGTGSDTISGGAGDDTIDGGSSGEIAWIEVANGQTVAGTAGSDYYRVLAEPGANVNITLDGGTGTDNDGDTVADHVHIASTNSTNLIDIRGFDYGTDRIVLQEMPVSWSFTANPGDIQGSITYANGNTQQIHLKHSGPAGYVFSDIFTTQLPVAQDDDSLSGGDGSDIFIVRDGFGTDTIDGGEGGTDEDMLDLSGLSGPVTVTFTGTGAGTVTDGTDTLTFSGIERMILTDGADVVDATADSAGVWIDARGGNDSILGGTGADTILDGDGRDTVRGGDGNDAIGDPANPGASDASDLLEGGAGNDTISGGFGSDTVHGGDGDDVLYEGSTGTFGGQVYGDAGNDTIYGGTGSASDYLSGGDGHDLIVDTGRGDSNDTLDGGLGNDTLFAGAGSDTVTGGDGDDLIKGDSANLLVNGGFEAGRAPDSFDAGATVSGWSSSDGFIEVWGSGTQGVTSQDGGNFIELDRAGAVDAVWQDVQTTGGQSYTLSIDARQRTGSDSFEVWFNSVRVATITPTNAWATYSTTVTGTGGLDRVEFRELAGENNRFGPLLDNAALVPTGSAILTSSDFGNDSLDGGAGADTIEGDAGDDTISGGTGADLIFGGAGADSIVGDAGNDLIHGGAGNDTLEGRSGADTIHGGDGDDVIDDQSGTGNGTGNDSFHGDAGNDLIYGGDGNDSLYGGTGDDTLVGEAGSDFLSGGDGNDVFWHWDTDGGLDTMLGGADSDRFEFWTLRTSIVDGGEGVTTGTDDDVLDLSRISGPVTVTFTGTGAGTVTDGIHTLTFSGIERLILTEGADLVDASADTAGMQIEGLGGDDTITGGSGADTIDAGAGNDVIGGGAGNDRLTTGDGQDTLVLADGSGNDTVTDFDTADVDADGRTDDQFDVTGMTDDDGGGVQSWDVSTVDDGAGNARLQFPASTSSSVTMESTPTTQMDEGAEYQAAGIPCFTAGTLIATPGGAVPVELLRPGDLVLTRDNGPQRLLWVAMRRIGPSALAMAPNLRPVEISAGAFGTHDRLVVSPQHGLLLRHDETELFVRARHLARLPGGAVRSMAGCRRVTYFHILFERHEVVFSNGLASESFFPGPEGLKGLESSAAAELDALFPGLCGRAGREGAQVVYSAPARTYSRRGLLPETIRAFAMTA